MAALVLVEAVAIALLGVLVVGLLRSHAEILRSLHRLGAGVGGAATGAAAGSPGIERRARRWPYEPIPPAGPATARAIAHDILGVSPAGEAVQVGVRSTRHDTLVAFLSSGCTTCGEFWRAFAQPDADLGLPPATRLVVVTKDAAQESLAGVRALAPAGTTVVMSTEAWTSYAVPVTPYFIHVDGPSGAVVGQGAAATWAQVSSLLRQSAGDDRAGGGRRANAFEREATVDAQLLAAGVRPGDPSLYPSRRAGDAST